MYGQHTNLPFKLLDSQTIHRILIIMNFLEINEKYYEIDSSFYFRYKKWNAQIANGQTQNRPQIMQN